MSSNQQRFLALPFFLGLIGILFSVWHLWGDSSILCVTEGCTLFQNFEIAGISMWWLGLVGCALLTLAAIPGFSGAGMFMAGAGLLLDCVLLIIMLTTAPCFSCLLIGGLLALLFVVYRSAVRYDKRQRPPYPTSYLLTGWILLFLLNMGSLANAETKPWALPSSSGSVPATEASIQIYFSPSCSACRELVAATAGASQTDKDRQIAWYPVEEEPRDVWVIAALKKRMDNGEALAPALEAAIAETPAILPPRQSIMPGMLWMQYKLWRNRAYVLKSGSTRLPFVEFRGTPAMLLPEARQSQPAAAAPPANRSIYRSPAPRTNVDVAPPLDLSRLEVNAFCDGSDEPCESSEQDAASLQDIMTSPTS